MNLSVEARPLPAPLVVAVVGIGVHTFNHVSVVVQDIWRLISTPDQATFNPGTIYHPVSAVLYAVLAMLIYRGRNWARVVMTVQLAGQAVGRCFVFQAFPTVETRAELITGWALSAVVLVLLWAPAATRRHFR